MTAQEIKKAYQKAKKAYEKRTGDKKTWVMNARQQKLGTATILYTMAWDYEDALRGAERSLANHEKDWAEKIADYTREAKKEAWQNKHTPGWFYGKNRTFWQDIIANTEKLAADKARELESRQRLVDTYEKKLAEFGDYRQELKNKIAKAEAFIAEPELQEFLKTTGARAFVEPKDRGERYGRSAEIYIRFKYTAEA